MFFHAEIQLIIFFLVFRQRKHIQLSVIFFLFIHPLPHTDNLHKLLILSLPFSLFIYKTFLIQSKSLSSSSSHFVNEIFASWMNACVGWCIIIITIKRDNQTKARNRIKLMQSSQHLERNNVNFNCTFLLTRKNDRQGNEQCFFI